MYKMEDEEMPTFIKSFIINFEYFYINRTFTVREPKEETVVISSPDEI